MYNNMEIICLGVFVSMIQWFLEPFKKYADFNGRARRKEYWTFNIGIGIINFICNIIYSATSQSNIVGVLVGIFGLAILIPSIAVTVRRLHDVGRSGKSYFFILIPLVGAILMLIWTLKDSEPGTNQYGINPKA